MRKFYQPIFSFFMLIAMAVIINYAYADGKKPATTDTTRLAKVFTNKNDKSYLKNGIKVALPPLRSTVTIYSTKPFFSRTETDRLVSNVQVYPNPITDQINLRYSVNKNSSVTIKIMDILGNEVITLFSQRVDPGEQKFTFNLNNRLSSGFYFLRLVAGGESVIKKISIL
ncbi:T9SS type A sorting domain-containing protein [Mucilaginibacter sp. AW1-3]